MEDTSMADDTISHDEIDVSKVWDMIEDISLCMLATHDGQAIRARPMHARPRESERAIYFLTDADSHKSEEISDNSAVCLTFAKPGDGKFLAVSGTARVLNDRPLIRALWEPEAKVWWDGPDDPSVRVIEVTPIDAEYWTGPNNFVATIAMVAAAVAGDRPDLGEQRKVDLH
jgi:general stress protein 26